MSLTNIGKKTLCIIQARMGSTRLPGKVLKKIRGIALLEHCIRRVEQAEKIDKVVVATTINKEDDKIIELCRQMGVDCYRGSSDDVLDRYYGCALVYPVYENIVRVTSDCPLIDPNVIDMCVEAFEKSGCDYISNVVPGERTFPRGLDVEVFSRAALKKAKQNASEDYEREHVTPHIWQNKNGHFRIGKMVTASPAYQSDYRLTVDYPEDFIVIERIYDELYESGEIIDVRDVIKFLKDHPEVVKINVSCEQKPLK